MGWAGTADWGGIELLERVRVLLPDAEPRPMAGGTGFLVDGSLACSVASQSLLVRVARAEQETLAGREGVAPMARGSAAADGWPFPDVTAGRAR